jgi:hypothetical protein
MERAARTRARPPQRPRVPRSAPLSRLRGATPTRAATCLWVSVPSAGTSANDVGASTRPPPGTLRGGCSRSRRSGLAGSGGSSSSLRPAGAWSSQMMCRSRCGRALVCAWWRRCSAAVNLPTSWRRRSSGAASCWVASSVSGRGPGRTASAKWARTWASRRSVLASRPVAQSPGRPVARSPGRSPAPDAGGAPRPATRLRRRGCGHTRHHPPFVAPRCFEHECTSTRVHEYPRGQHPQRLDQGRDGGCAGDVAVRDAPLRPAGAPRDVQPGVGHINPDHAPPCRRMEGRRRRPCRHAASPLRVPAACARAPGHEIPPCVMRARSRAPVLPCSRAPVLPGVWPRHRSGCFARPSATTHAATRPPTHDPGGRGLARPRQLLAFAILPACATDKEDDNAQRPHGALQQLPPAVFALSIPA